MEVGVQGVKENPYTDEKVRSTTAYLTFVALDENLSSAHVHNIFYAP